MPDALTAPLTDLREGDVFAGCRVEAVAGRGGMGIVYRAVQLSLGRPVALKLIASQHAADPEFRDRFEREARLAAAIDHPNVIPVYAAGEEDGRLYLVVRFVRGTDLHHLIRNGGPLPPARAAALIEQVGLGLDAAHAAGLVHRDVKPANVLISVQGDHVYLTDFGLSRLVSSDTRLTTTGNWLGTAAYASPEHLRGERTDARSDVYALGCVLHAALTGEPPFPRQTVPATMLAHLHDAPPRPSERGLPRAFDEVIGRALAKDPVDRYPSAGDLGRAARAAAAGEDQPTHERSVAKGPAAPSEMRTVRRPPTTPSQAATLWASHTEAARTAWAPPTGHAAAAPADATAVPAAATTDRRDDRLPPPPPPPEHAGPMPEEVRVRRSRRGRIRMLAAALLVGALAAGAFTTLGDALTGETIKKGPLSTQEVEDAAQSFADAYANEDTRALGASLTHDVQRVLPAGRLNGRAAVVSEYRRQFRAQNTDGYDLSDVEASGGSAGRASGRYAVKIDGKEQITGRIVFSVVRDGHGKPRIAMIAATPD
jgi:ketosteroid isomerase-like protein